MTRLKLYLSSATRQFAAPELRDLLGTSRVNNWKAGVTGMLLHHDGNFLQLLEGDAGSIESIWSKIARDPRHRGIIVMLDEPREQRLFPEWSMGFRHGLPGEHLAGWSDFLERAEDGASSRCGDVALSMLASFRDNIRG